MPPTEQLTLPLAAPPVTGETPLAPARMVNEFVYKPEIGEKHIGLQFLGGEQIQFVIFSRRGEHNNMARIRGRDDFSGIARQLDASAVGDVIYA